MGRKIDRVGQMVSWFQDEPLPTITLMIKMLQALVAKRTLMEDAKPAEPAKAPQKPVRRGRGPNKPKVTPVRAEPAVGTMPDAAGTTN